MRSLLCAAACLLVVLVTVADARPQAKFRTKRSAGVMKAVKRCLSEDFKQLDDLVNDGSLTSEEKAKLKEIFDNELSGLESDEELEEMVEFLFSLKDDPVGVFKELEDELGDTGSLEKFKMPPPMKKIDLKPIEFKLKALRREFGKTAKKSKKSWDDLLDMDEDKLETMAAEISDLTGESVDADDVGSFLEEHGKEAEEAFFVVAKDLTPGQFQDFEALLQHDSGELLASFLDELDNRGLLDKKRKRAFGKTAKKAKKSWDDLLEMDEDKLETMAAEISALTGDSVDADDVGSFLEKHGEEAEEAFYEVAQHLTPEQFKDFEALLQHNSGELLASFLDELDNRGLLDDEKEASGKSKAGTKGNKSWDDLLDMDEDKLKTMAAEISALTGESVDADDVGSFLEEHGEEAEEAFYEVAQHLTPEQFKDFEALLQHNSGELLGSFLDELDNRGLLDKKRKRSFLKR